MEKSRIETYLWQLCKKFSKRKKQTKQQVYCSNTRLQHKWISMKSTLSQHLVELFLSRDCDRFISPLHVVHEVSPKALEEAGLDCSGEVCYRACCTIFLDAEYSSALMPHHTHRHRLLCMSASKRSRWSPTFVLFFDRLGSVHLNIWETKVYKY